MDRIVIVGASLAGLSAAKALRADGFAGTIAMVGDEPHLPYDRPPLSKEVLTGAKQERDLLLPGVEELDAEWELGVTATGLDVPGRRLLTDHGDLAYDGLVIATGVRPRLLPGFRVDRQRVFVLRALDDALALHEVLREQARVLVVGSGFIGVEVAVSARSLGCDVTILSMTEPLAVAGVHVSRTCSRLLAGLGVRTIVGPGIVRSDIPEGGGGRVLLEDGAHLDFDVVVIAVGSAPNVEWLADSGLDIRDGVLCDPTCTVVGAPEVVAAGDVARWPNPAFGGTPMRIEHWANAVEQGTASGRNVARPPAERVPFHSLPSFWSDHGGPRLQSIGIPHTADRFELLEGELDGERYALAAYRGAELVGGLGYGTPRALARLRARLAAPVPEGGRLSREGSVA